MALKHYYKCIFTIKDGSVLKRFYENGQRGEFVENRSWSTAQELVTKHGELSPIYILFADSGRSDTLMYYELLNRIEVEKKSTRSSGRGRYETTVHFSGMELFSNPRPSKVQLEVLSRGEDMSENQINGYTICRTPHVLLGSEYHKILDSRKPDEIRQKDAKEEVCNIIRSVTGKRITSGKFYLCSSDLTKKEEYEVLSQTSTSISELIFERHNLTIDPDDIAYCVTVEKLVNLVEKAIEERDEERERG